MGAIARRVSWQWRRFQETASADREDFSQMSPTIKFKLRGEQNDGDGGEILITGNARAKIHVCWEAQICSLYYSIGQIKFFRLCFSKASCVWLYTLPYNSDRTGHG